jgi:DNA invertase Pin-like site-specific DNA recombinase
LSKNGVKNIMTFLGYMRVSKNDGSQTLDLQRDALKAAGVSEDRLYQDFASGKRDDRPGLQACLKALQPQNTLVVWKLDRLGRDLKHLVVLVDELRQRQVGFKVLTGHGAQIDTTTPNGRLAFGLFAALAEYERELIIERTQAGLRAARARGRMGGRPRKMSVATLRMAMVAMADSQAVSSDIAKQLGITTATLYTYVNGDGTLKPPGQLVLAASTQRPRKNNVNRQEERMEVDTTPIPANLGNDHARY